MAIDNTHTKYLKGKDKKAWSGFKDAYESSKKLGNFLDAFTMPDLKEGEEMEIPLRTPKTKNNNTTK